MKGLIKLALLLVAGILGYNYFFGTAEEKASSEKVFNQVKEVGRSIGDLVKNEKQKFADGKYDKTFDKLNDVYDKAKEKIKNKNVGKEATELERLENRKQELLEEKEKIQEQLESGEASEETVEESKSLEKELGELLKESKSFLEKILKEQ